jgi:hypothetical protein
MTVWLLLWALGPRCELVVDWTLGCEHYVLRLSECERMADWICN